MDAVYKDYTIFVQPKELKSGRWEWDLTIFPKNASNRLPRDIFSSLESHASREEAEHAGLEYAKGIIDEA